MPETTTTEVILWGTCIGRATMQRGDLYATFLYDDDFLSSRIELAPMVMPLAPQPYRFANLARDTFHGLPGLLADSLPDKFGNALIDAWLQKHNRPVESFNAVERLCYTGQRGMGALEFRPMMGPRPGRNTSLELAQLVELASEILGKRESLDIYMSETTRERALREILRVGTSAGGSRPKAVIAWNPETNEIRSGQVSAGAGFSYWLLKFDGVATDGQTLTEPAGYGAVEYAYHLMARAAGVEMSECRLLEEGGRRHFMTRRFDRLDNGDKLHMQSLSALMHYDFNAPGVYSYEQAFHVLRRLELAPSGSDQLFRRMVFNIVARNQDDHVKNIAFLMDRNGKWTLAPAFDVTYSYAPTGRWTSVHQMTLQGKRDNFTLSDFRACAKIAGLKQGRADALLRVVIEAVSRWPEFAEQAGVNSSWVQSIRDTLRLTLEP